MPQIPTVGVVLPVYNGAAFVSQAVQSIQKQSFADWELVVLDDGSRDGSLDICRSLASADERIRVFRNETNQGLAKTMNRLAALARGRYIAVQEQDDVSEPSRLDLEVALLEAKPEVGLVSGLAAWMDDNGEIKSLFPGILDRGEQYPQDPQQMVRFLYTEQCKVVNAACMFRRELIEGNPTPFDPEALMSIDWQFFLHIAHRYRIWGIPQVLVCMRRGVQHQSLTRQQELKFREARRCLRLIYERYSRESDSPIDRRLYREAMATELVIEGRSYGRLKGLLRLLEAIVYHPGKRQGWISLLELGGRAVKRTFVRPRFQTS